MAAMVPGRKFSSTMSDFLTRSVKICLPSAVRMSRQMAFLAAVVDGEVDALAAHDGWVLAGFLTAEAFDFDDLGAEVGEDHAAARAGLVAGEFENADAGEGLGHGRGSLGGWRGVSRAWGAGVAIPTHRS